MANVLEIAKRARAAALELSGVSEERKNAALARIAELLEQDAENIIAANSRDLEKAAAAGLSKPMLERLSLDRKKIAGIADGVRQVAALPDPVGEIIETVVRPNGLEIQKVRTPIGVIGIIYESRPNVTVDCAVLCLKSGNAAILRGGSEAFESNAALAAIISRALSDAGINPDCVQIIPTTDRAAFGELLKLDKYVNCIIPRGGEGLIRFVVQNSTIPVIKHYKGVCTVYIDKDADAEIARVLAVDSKCQRPSVCNAAENLILHAAVADKLLPIVAGRLSELGVEIRASDRAAKILDNAGIPHKTATDDDFYTEYIDMIISVDIVDSVEEAAAFINKYGSGHSDLIVTQNQQTAEKFMNLVDSAAVYWNASTRFTDGYEFGLGAEIGISTDKLHARGPMGLKELCSYKYKIRGAGQTRGKPDSAK